MLIRMSAGDLNAYVGLLALAQAYSPYGGAEEGFYPGPGLSVVKRVGGGAARTSDSFVLLYNVTALFASSETGPGSMHAPVLVSLAAGLLFGTIAQKNRACFGQPP